MHFNGRIDNFMSSIAIFNLETLNFKTKQEQLLSCNRNRKRTKKYVPFLIRQLIFRNKPFSGFLEHHNFFFYIT